jgi:hypothetical protein
MVELVEEKLTFKKSKKTSERLKKINEFIEKKKKELQPQPGPAEAKPAENSTGS